ncbi:polysaccharide deacetylase family protein [Chlorobium sp. N1]|uniref:polysaccharide deacetylase family protein n=1 Tax=Chlorobium sp. N1 TaxID=2491138 RepID=UPI00103CA90E|nr:polysaccharide deacetylase family protein [Chlorobium sp. N1]TCD48348.1 xylanase [Chlorobium sp. N1]
MKSIISTVCILFSLFASLTACAAKPLPVPVLLTLDTELDGDVAALETLGIDVPATYFITGKFAVAYPAVVDTLSKAGNTIGSHSHAHPHLPTLSQDSLESEIRISKTILESITKKPVVWFRAPYMEYDERVMKALRAQGFLYDSSDSEHWEEQAVIAEMPISDIRRGAMLASDYDLIVEQHMSGKDFENALKELYRSKSVLGQPAVILLHPKNAAIHPKALRNFIGYVKNEGGRFVTADQYIAEIQSHQPERYAVWVDFSEGRFSPEYIVSNIARTSVTDVFLMAKDAQGTFYYGPKSADDVFGRTLSLLRSRGLNVKVHAWLSGLSDTQVLKKHHGWAMTAQNGRLSANWMSPSNPEVVEYMKSTVTEIIRNYGVDGIHLDRISYPDLDYDYSKGCIASFAESATPGSVPSLNALLTTHYNSWVNWRSNNVAEYAEAVGTAVRKAGGGRNVEFSAELQSDKVYSFNNAELSGQEVSLLAPAFDFLVPRIMVSGTPDDTGLIERSIVSFRMRVGEKPLLLRIVGPSAGRIVSNEYLSSILGALSRGGDGMGFSSYSAVFGNQRGERSFNEQGLEMINRAFDGQGLRPFVMLSADTRTFQGFPVLPGAFTLLMVVVFNMVAMPVFGRKSSGSGVENSANADVPGKVAWVEVDVRIKAGILDGPSADQVCGLLRSYDARGVHQNRVALVLDAIDRSSSPMPILYEAVSGSREWMALALKYLHEVCLLGYAEIDNQNLMLTPEGLSALEKARTEGFDAQFWAFIEERLRESLLVVCPDCGAETLTSFYWLTYECSGCGKPHRLEDSSVLAVYTAGGGLVRATASAAG